MSSKSRILKRIRNSALIKNPVLFEAVGLCPVVAIALSLRLALFLAVVTAVEMIICEVLASLLLKNVRRCWRVALYVIFSVGVLFPITYGASRFLPDTTSYFGIYLPLMAVNSLIALHCERVAVKNSAGESFVDAVSASLSYGAVALIVGVVREILANGSIGGFDIHMPVKFSALTLPFGGLLIMGFSAAALKAFLAVKYPDKSPDRAFDTSEIRRSVRGSLRELMSDDYNPYDDGAETPAMPAKAETAHPEKETAEPEQGSAEKAAAKHKADEEIIVFARRENEESGKGAPVAETEPADSGEQAYPDTQSEEPAVNEAEIPVEKEKSRSFKRKKEKRVKKKEEKPVRHKNRGDKKRGEGKTSAAQSARREREESSERTYLDDFSEMLSELEAFENAARKDNAEDGKNGGGEQQ